MNPIKKFQNLAGLGHDPWCSLRPVLWISAAVLLLAAMPSAAQVLTAWVARYNAPVLGTGDASGRDIAVDGAGNAYVASLSYDDIVRAYAFATVKYDPSGKQLWAARDRWFSSATDLVVDSAGNAYHAGADTNFQCVAVKYDANGNQVWVARYPEAGITGAATAITVDLLGNVIVTGSVRSGAGDNDYGTVKYNSSGQQLWTAHYSGPGTTYKDDIPVAVETDSSGNVYVTGYSSGTSGAYEYATVKYDSGGNQLWVTRYHGAGGYDHPTALKVDSGGNVYVTGISARSFTIREFATLKYDTNGNQLWAARYNGTNYVVASALALDGAGNVCVTGCSGLNSPEYDYTTLKYGTNGNLVWSRSYHATEGPSYAALKLDSQGNLYAVGGSTVKYDPNGNQLWTIPMTFALDVDRAGNVIGTYSEQRGPQPPPPREPSDCVTTKYATDGNWLWTAYYNAPGNSDDEARAIAVDGAGNVYVTGGAGAAPYTAFSSLPSQYTTIKYNAQGDRLWVAREPGVGEASAIAVDGAGNVFVTGCNANNYLTIRYDSKGNRLWGSYYVDPQYGLSGANAIKVDSAGNVYVTGGSYHAGVLNSDYVTIKYGASGNQLWAARYNGPASADDFPSALALDAKGNVYVTGQSIGSGTGYDYATVKYDSNGSQLWVARYASPGNVADAATALAVDGAGNVYVTGSAGNGNATIKYDTNGRQLWMVNTNLGFSGGASLALDAAGNVYVNPAGTLSKYDSNGNRIWAAPGSGGTIALDGAGNVYVAGGSYSSESSYDYATTKYDAHGNQVWAIRYDGPAHLDDGASGLAVDSWGNAYVTGYSAASAASGQTAYDYATVKYVSAPAIAPGSQTAEAGASARFSVSALGGQPLTYEWFFNRTNLICVSSNRSLQIIDVRPPQAGAYILVVTNASGVLTSSPALLGVIPPVPRRMVPALTLSGPSGSSLNLDSSDAVDPAAAWTTFDAVSLTSTSQWYFDVRTSLPPAGFYRTWTTDPINPPSPLVLHVVPALTLTGAVGSSIRLDAINQIGPTDAWWTLDTITLTNTSQLYFDTSSIGQPPRLWRIVPVP